MKDLPSSVGKIDWCPLIHGENLVVKKTGVQFSFFAKGLFDEKKSFGKSAVRGGPNQICFYPFSSAQSEKTGKRHQVRFWWVPPVFFLFFFDTTTRDFRKLTSGLAR